MRRKPVFTPEALFEWACDYCHRHEVAGHGSTYPTFSEAAKHFGVTLDELEGACGMWGGPGYMAPGVAVGLPGGHGRTARRSQWVVEAYR